ncbi:MAG: hypothetical protein A2Y33_13525 [Spirochaetes bacterium GWF1_51_8]|nr:MAG: hypothetical protein A2Y33_13525 [Spirochaetes bacterium GWF1_51_8]
MKRFGVCAVIVAAAVFSGCGSVEQNNNAAIPKPPVKQVYLSEPAGGDNFGKSVAMTGDGRFVLVGAPGVWDVWQQDQGAAYLYYWNDKLGWTEVYKFTASDGGWGDLFGKSVAISDDAKTVAISASSADVGKFTNTGAVYVYRWDNMEWVEGKIIPSDATNNLNMGECIDLSPDGGTVVAGGRWKNSSKGCAYVFRLNNVSFTEYILTASDGAALDAFGYSVAVSAYGHVVAVGSWLDTVGANNDQGSVYVYKWNGAGYAESAFIASFDGQAGDQFSYSLDISDDGQVIAAGSFNADFGTTNTTGAVYVLKYKEYWDQTKLVHTDAEPSDHFGSFVTISGDGKYVIGWASFKNNQQGAVYGFRCESEYVWTQDKKLVAADPQDSDYFGAASALSYDGSEGAIGVYLDDIELGDQGSVFIYHW